MLEAAMLNIIVDFEIDPLKTLTTESAVAVIKMLESFFARAFSFGSSF